MKAFGRKGSAFASTLEYGDFKGFNESRLRQPKTDRVECQSDTLASRVAGHSATVIGDSR
jgi:hypothetical protein